MARQSIPEQGYPATRLKAADLLGEQSERDKLRVAKRPKSQAPEFEYGTYTDVTGRHALSFEQKAVDLNNPQYAQLVNYAVETGDIGVVQRYHSRVHSNSEDIQQFGPRVRESREAFEADEALKIPYNKDLIAKQAKLLSSLDPNDPYIMGSNTDYLLVSNPSALEGSSLESQIVQLPDGRLALPKEGEVKDLFYFDKSMLISPEDWMEAARKHSADIIKWSRTDEEPNASGNIVTSSGGQRIDTDKLFYNSALRLFEDARLAYMEDPGEDVELPEYEGGYRLNAMSASMYSKLFPDQSPGDYKELIGKKIHASVANVLLADFVSAATEGEVKDSRLGRRIEAVRKGGGGGTPVDNFGISPKRLATDQPIRVGSDYTVSYKKQPKIKWENVPEDKSSVGYISDSTVMQQPDGSWQVTVTYTTTPSASDYYQRDEESGYKRVAEKEGEEKEGGQDLQAWAGTEKKPSEQDKKAGKTAVTKYTKTLTLNESNELRSQLGYKSFKEWYDDQQSIGKQADDQWFESVGADELLNEIE